MCAVESRAHRRSGGPVQRIAEQVVPNLVRGDAAHETPAQARSDLSPGEWPGTARRTQSRTEPTDTTSVVAGMPSTKRIPSEGTQLGCA